MKRNFIVMSIVVCLLLLHTEVVNAYRSYDDGFIANNQVHYEFENFISQTKQSGNASTETHNQFAGATANATFYWTDYENETFGSSYKHFSNYGSASVYADSLANTEKYYYKVVSYHEVSYYHDGFHASYSNTLTTYCP